MNPLAPSFWPPTKVLTQPETKDIRKRFFFKKANQILHHTKMT